MVYSNIKLTIYQMIYVGVHLGHSISMSIFLSYWMFGGERNSLFIIDLVKTKLLIKKAIDQLIINLSYSRPFWFINTVAGLGEHIYKYALLCGEPYCIYKWAYGSITNITTLSRWNWILIKLLNEGKYKLRSKDKKKILSFTGFLLNRWVKPGMGFISRPIESKHIIAEFNTAKVDYIIIIDSNVNSEAFLFPISGNDDSAICLNFYSYLFSIIIFSFKLRNIIKFERWVYTKYKKKPLDINNKLLNLYLYKNANSFSVELNNNVLKSYVSFINNSYKSFNWLLNKNTLIDLHIKYSFFALYDLETVNRNWEIFNNFIEIPISYKKSKNDFNPYIIF